MTRPLRIGLTGGIASGKSSVSARFRELGVSVIDADESARRVVAPGTPGLAAVLREFGPDLLEIRIGEAIPVDRDADPAAVTSILEYAVRKLCQ